MAAVYALLEMMIIRVYRMWKGRKTYFKKLIDENGRKAKTH
jgi:hypothetical protein